MVGISAYGAYIPRYRLKREVINSAIGWLNPVGLRGEKAVANYDEDSITMAIAASVNCLNGFDRGKVDALYFATTTSPYKERQGAGIIATALDLRPDIETTDFAGSAKAGTAAILSAYNAVKAGAAKSVMVCASDCRLGKPGSTQEYIYGDGGAAFLVGDGELIAALEGYHSFLYDFMGYWRAEGDVVEHSWEDRWVRDEGYVKLIPEAVSG